MTPPDPIPGSNVHEPVEDPTPSGQSGSQLPVATPEQVQALLRSLGAGARAYVFVVEPDPMPGAGAGLEVLGEPVFLRYRWLVTFYLVGCAFHDGATSINAVAAELESRDLAGRLPEGVRTSPSGLSEMLPRLADEVFAPFFRMQRHHLALTGGPEGRAAGLTPGGERAWQATEAFLRKYHLLPVW